MASYVEDRIQRSFYMVRMSAPPPAPLEGTPEAIGKADYVETVIQDITSMLGITSGLWQARACGAAHDCLRQNWQADSCK